MVNVPSYADALNDQATVSRHLDYKSHGSFTQSAAYMSAGKDGRRPRDNKYEEKKSGRDMVLSATVQEEAG